MMNDSNEVTVAPARPITPAPALPSPPEANSAYAQDVALLKHFVLLSVVLVSDAASSSWASGKLIWLCIYPICRLLNFILTGLK